MQSFSTSLRRSSGLVLGPSGYGQLRFVPEIAALQRGRDLSAEAHRAALLAWFSSVDGLGSDLSEALYEQLLAPEFWQPYSDSEYVLHQLDQLGVAVGVVSNIPWDIRGLFARHGLLEFVDVFVLSFEHGVEKPDPRLFDVALDELGVTADAAIHVGDSPSADGGAVGAGLAVVLLPPQPVGSARGLDLVLNVAQAVPDQGPVT